MEADAPCERQQPLPLHFRVPGPLTCHFRSVQAPLGAQCQPGAASDRPSAGPLPSCPPLWSRQGRAGNPNALSGPRSTARKLGGWAPAASGGGAQGCSPVAGCHPLQASQTRVPPSPEMSASRVRRPPTRQLCSSPASPHSRCCGAGGQSGASPIARQAWALNRGVCTLLSNEGRWLPCLHKAAGWAYRRAICCLARALHWLGPHAPPTVLRAAGGKARPGQRLPLPYDPGSLSAHT